ncbi:hypothetical protein OQA88_1706 [Cercophora sp. LCS_1]
MLRRSHKKSRAGCLECKRRHVKCDEQRPVCIICTLSERPCSYPPNSQPERPSPPESAYSSPGPSTVSPSTPYNVAAELPIYPSLSTDVNFDHMELLLRFDSRSQYPDTDALINNLADKLHNDAMLQAPYYLLETLALSARRLAHVEPEKSEHYLNYAVTLQTKAVSLYNHVVSTVKIDSVNCVPITQFSSLLGRHLLVDLWARRDADFNVFLHHYLEFIKVQTGIKLITHSAWPELMNSELKDLLFWAGSLHTKATTGHECDALHHLVRNATGLDAPTLEACEKAISSLQIGFDLAQESPPRCFIVFHWSVAAPDLFTELIAQRRPEALVCLAYWGVLCHLVRDLWQVGGAGSYIINSVAQYLGPDWAPFMAYPLSFLT